MKWTIMGIWYWIVCTGFCLVLALRYPEGKGVWVDWLGVVLYSSLAVSWYRKYLKLRNESDE